MIPHTLSGAIRGNKDYGRTLLKHLEAHLMFKHLVVIYWSEDDQAFLAEVPELPGCMADGPTKAAALAAAEQVAQEWIDTAQELGRPIPAPRGRLLFA